MKGAAVTTAAAAVAVGMDGMRILTTQDPTERLVLQAVAERATEFVRAQAETQAVLIANAVGALLGGARKR